MQEVTRILNAIDQGDPHAAEQLLPLVYKELRKLAAQKLAQEKPGQTLQATALVHEAYLRLVDAKGTALEQPRTFLWRGGRGDAANSRWKLLGGSNLSNAGRAEATRPGGSRSGDD